MCQYIQLNGTEEGRTPFVVNNELFMFEYWVEVMRRRPVALSETAPVADLYLVRALVAIKMRVVPA